VILVGDVGSVHHSDFFIQRTTDKSRSGGAISDKGYSTVASNALTLMRPSQGRCRELAHRTTAAIAYLLRTGSPHMAAATRPRILCAESYSCRVEQGKVRQSSLAVQTCECILISEGFSAFSHPFFPFNVVPPSTT
jgi:hypothetical protein